jgi:LL-diaminopimelate aminotransferase
MRSKRLEQLPPYLFFEIDKLRESYRTSGGSPLDLGIGDPDLGAPRELLESLACAIQNREPHRDPPGRGLPRLIDAVREWAREYHGVSLDRENVLVTIGSKEAIGHLPLALVNPGDAVIIPDPGYPVYRSGSVFAGFDALNARDLARARILFINYPNNPTAGVADRALFRKAIAFCGEHGVVLANDAAYSEIWYEEPTVPLFPMARSSGIPFIEFFSFSKTFSITGWRIGFAIGSKEIVSSLADLKNNLDSGVFGAIQEAVAETMERHYAKIMEGIRNTYRERRDALAASLDRSGLSFQIPRASFYFWVRTPHGTGSVEYCRFLIKELGIVATPGVGFGQRGEGYFRLSITTDVETIREAGRRLEGLRARIARS